MKTLYRILAHNLKDTVKRIKKAEATGIQQFTWIMHYYLEQESNLSLTAPYLMQKAAAFLF